MERPAGAHLLAGLEGQRLSVDQVLVVFEEVAPAIEIPPLVFVVGVAPRPFVGRQVGVFEFVAAEIHPARVVDLVDLRDGDIEAVVVNLGVLVEHSLDAVGDGHGRV